MAEVSIVVTTIGRPDELDRLLASVLPAAADVQAEVIVVDQSADRVCQRVVDEWSSRLPVQLTTSERGASRGRNVGERLARGQVLTFPDDTCWYDVGTIAAAHAVLRRHPEWDMVSGIQRTAAGRPSMLRWATSAQQVRAANIHRTVIESSLFIRRALFEAIGAFDESIGTGSSGPYQSGEATDLVLRALERGHRVHYDPSLCVRQDDPRDRVDERYVAKMRGYGAGFGYVHRRHRMPVSLFAWFMTRKALGAGTRAARGRRDLAKADVAFMRAAVAGYRNGVPPDRA